MRFIPLILVLLITLTACDEELGPGAFVDEPLVLSSSSNYNADQCGPEIYPCPPYGTRQYQTVRDIPFLPANPITEEIAGDDGIARLKYFYSLKEQGYKLLLITLTAEWCHECDLQMEATLPILDVYGINAASPEVAFLAVVTEDNGLENATLEVASTYSTNHDFDHVVPITNDENMFFRELMTSSTYPFNIFIDLSNMEIIGYDSGLNNETVFTEKLDEMLDFVSK